MTRSTLYRAAVAAAFVTVPLSGCRRREVSEADLRREPTREELAIRNQFTDEPTAIGGGPVAINEGMRRIIEARCDREAKCGFIAPDQKWASREACLEVVTREYSDDLTDADCPVGIGSKELDECVQASRTADCASAIDVVGRVAACRPSNLCRNFQ